MTEQSLLDPARLPSAAGVARAAAKVAEILPATPLLPLEIDGQTVWCKAENLQPIGAFKIRGGWHRLTDLSPEQRARGVVAFSSGNHAQGVAWAAQRLGIAATIIMPADAPEVKVENTKALGAAVVSYDRLREDRAALAAKLAGETGATVVPSFDDPWIIEGQGSAGVELRDQMLALTGVAPDQIITCCGGGGLASGIALANPDARIAVVEPEGWDDMGESLRVGRIVPVGPNPPPTLCDALQTLKVSPLTYNILQARSAAAFSVTNDEVLAAMRLAMERLKLVIEPGGAVALAAAMGRKIPLSNRTVITLSGGNVDAHVFASVMNGN